MRSIDSISVLLPTWQAMEFLERVFDALSAQECSLPWDVHVIDSGSSDGTPEYLEARAENFPVPLHITRIPQQEFDHGDTRNQLAASSTGELLVLLTQDAIPSRPDWLSSLASNFDHSDVGAAYCRNVPRKDALLLTRVFSRSDPGYQTQRSVSRMPSPVDFARLSPDDRRLLYNFNDVASAVRRELWERHPFPRTMMGEDILMCRAVIHAGYSVVYDAHATVDHSHDYGPQKMHWRGEVDARFNAEWLDRVCIDSVEDSELLAGRLVEEDMAILDLELGLSGAQRASLLKRARELRLALCRGLLEGGESTVRYSSTRMRAVASLRLLYVIGSGGTTAELAARRALALALKARGHSVHIVHLDAYIPDSANLAEEALAGDGSGDSLAEFESLLAQRDPDVVHFHGLRGAQHGLVKVAHLAKVGSLISGVDLARLSSRKAPASLGLGTCLPPEGALPSDNHIFVALACTSMCLVESWEARERVLQAIHIEPARLVYSPPLTGGGESGGLVGNKTPQQQAAEFEYRYRGVACIEPKEIFLDCTGSDAESTKGVCEAQGADYLLLHPGARAEYALSGVLGGTARILIEQVQLAGESNIQLAGHILVAGRRVAQISNPGPATEDRVVCQLIEIELPPGTSTLQFATPRRLPWRRCYLRIARVQVARVSPGC